jgi:hypothetical protein
MMTMFGAVGRLVVAHHLVAVVRLVAFHRLVAVGRLT